jgi:urease accessory protein
MLTLTQRLSPETDISVQPLILALTAEERTRSRHRFETAEGDIFLLRLARGTVLQDGDLLQAETGEVVQITAKSELVLTVTPKNSLDLLRAAYHLGNRHIALEITPNYLRLLPDPVLKTMLVQLGLEVIEEIVPFYPEIGAYGHQH